MKLNKEYVLQQIAGSWVVVPLGKTALSFNGMLTLNETGVTLWQALEAGADREGLVQVLTSEYEVSPELAARDVDAFLEKLKEIGCLEEL